MKEKKVMYLNYQVELEVSEVEQLLRSHPDVNIAGLDNLDSKWLRMTACIIASPICHVINNL